MIHSKPTFAQYDRMIIGAGIFGLYAAWLAAKKGERVLVLEKEATAFTKASYVNQARIHSGYHYPRSMSTALTTAAYLERFVREFDFSINRSFEQIYAIARRFSYTNPDEYEKFCCAAGIRCDRVDVRRYFNPEQIEAAYSTDEYSIDAIVMRDFLLAKLAEFSSVTIWYNAMPVQAEVSGKEYSVRVARSSNTDVIVNTPKVMNLTYAGLNEVVKLFGVDPLPLKHEYTEVILVQVPEVLRSVGVTVMDGPFCSIMPFGFSGYHSLTAVTYTPHLARHETIDESTLNCTTHFNEMRQLARKFLRDGIDMTYERSLFTTKTTLAKTELDDARPTSIIEHAQSPYLVSVLSGKLNTIFDLEEII